MMILYVPGGHTLGVHRQDTGLDIIGPGLALLDGLGFKRAVTVTRHTDLALSPLALYGFLAVTVAAVAAVISRGTVLFIAEVLIHFRFERLLQCSRKKPFKFAAKSAGVVQPPQINAASCFSCSLNCVMETSPFHYSLGIMPSYTVPITPSRKGIIPAASKCLSSRQYLALPWLRRVPC